MQKGIGNFAFALFAALLLVGSAFAASMTNSTTVAANRAPVITSVGGPTSLSAGTEGTWSVSAYDPDGNYLSYAVGWGDNLDQRQAGQSASTSTATFQHTYSTAGTYTITFTVTDSNGAQTQSTITTTVTGTSKNHPPSFSSVSCPVTAKSATCYVYANDPDGDPVTYTINFGDSTGTVSGMQNVFVHTYQMAGTYTISIKAADKYGATATTSLQVTVTGNENQKPIISSVSGPSSLSVNQMGRWDITAYDPDGTYLEYSVNFGDDPAVTPTYVGSTAGFQHSYSKAGTYTLTFKVWDSQGATAQSSATVTVTNENTTQKGVALDTWAGVDSSKKEYMLYAKVTVDGRVPSDGEVRVDYEVKTPVGETKSSSIGQNTPNQGIYMLSFSNNMPCGSYSYKITAQRLSEANSANSASESGYFAMSAPYCTEISANKPPVISEVIGSASLLVNQAGTWKVSAYDPDGTSLSYSVVWGDEGTKEGAFAKDTGNSASFGHTYSKAGTYTITFTVTDSAGATATKSTTVSVIGVAPSEKITLKLVPGWNQISVPTMNLEVSDLAKKCDISQTVWYYNAASKQYATATSLGGGHVGYWVKANSACEYTLDSTYVTPAPGAFNLKAGWNMIGSPLKATAVADFAGNCKITSGAWHYSQVATSGQATNGEYVYSSKLEPGEGYWVKVAADCTMQSAVDSPPSAPTG